MALMYTSEEDLLCVYALYKQASEGPCPTSYWWSLTGIWDVSYFIKQKAWRSLGNMENDIAKYHYVQYFEDNMPGWEDALEDKGSNSLFSRMEEEDTAPSTSLFDFARDGTLEPLKQLIKMGADVNEKDEMEMTALHWAADRGSLPVVKELISAGATVNAQDDCKQTPLHVAYAQGDERQDIIAYLIEHGADETMEDEEGKIPKDMMNDQ
eukprot:CAMPEP_0168509936 /NCGR_PEP_ID=MMETSP0405-20121227/1114_1 /TAXON_ID=498012 /ORGANISM="Trichosphaerium sp, Strain Am-I-7 wt" /LENGTH=209 /DNA_ID=CAMNT_0008527573 /DNA_START=63 /DNA_END=692 /DNA_ORIENTATION=+